MILSISNLSIIQFNFLYFRSSYIHIAISFIRFVKQNLNYFCTKPHNVGPIPRPHSTLSWALAYRFRSAVVTLVQSVCEGEELHCLVLKSEFERFELVSSALLYLYTSCIDIEGAKRVFDELHGENELLWSLMLVGYVQCNLMSEALDLFNKMQSRDVVAWTTLISGVCEERG